MIWLGLLILALALNSPKPCFEPAVAFIKRYSIAFNECFNNILGELVLVDDINKIKKNAPIKINRGLIYL